MAQKWREMAFSLNRIYSSSDEWTWESVEGFREDRRDEEQILYLSNRHKCHVSSPCSPLSSSIIQGNTTNPVHDYGHN